MALATLPHAFGAPSDPFATATRDAKPPEGLRAPGDSRVSEQVGTASYQIAIDVPAGRGGMQPALALTYSSAGALRGGLAVGWSLDLPRIERDPDFPNENRYRTTLSGSSGKLIANTQDPGSGERYRAEVDGEFVRYQRDVGTGLWTARSADGHAYEFFQVDAGRWRLTKESDALGNTITYLYAGVAHDGYQEYVPSAIEYTSNAAASLGAHARVDFVYDGGTPGAPGALALCGGFPVGASVDLHSGFRRLNGARRLDEIRTSVKDTPSSAWRIARKVKLTYDAAERACGASALRYLTQLDVTARSPQGVETAAPPTRFSYGPAQRTLGRTLTVANAPREQGTLAGATSGFLDFDGDGRLDHVAVTSDPKCRLHWRKGLADGQFAAAAPPIDLPSADWKIPGQRNPLWEYCTLAGQFAQRSTTLSTKFCIERGASVTYNLTDWDNDGRMDLLSEPSASPCYMGGDFDDGFTCTDNGQGTPSSGGCPEGTTQTGTIDGQPNCTCGLGRRFDWGSRSCTASCPTGQVYNMVTASCDNPGGCTFGTNCPNPTDPGMPEPITPECVGGAPVVPGPPFLWRVQHGVPAFGGATLEAYGTSSYVTSPRPLPGGGASMGGLSNEFVPRLPSMIDIDGDGLQDLIGLTFGPYMAEPIVGIPGRHLYVWRGKPDGLSFEPAVRWRFAGFAPAPQGTDEAVGFGGKVFTTRSTVAFRDVNGDGLPDMLVQQADPTTGAPGLLGVSYNMPGGQGGGLPPDVVGAFGPIVSLGFPSPVDEARADVTYYTTPATWVEGYRGFLRRLIDLDGDGVLELIQQVPNGTIANPATWFNAYRILGGARTLDYRGLPPAEWEPLESLILGGRALPQPWQRQSDMLDLTGDGLPDAVSYDAAGTATIRTDAVGTPLRLLATIDNGRGGVTRFDYASTTDAAVVDLDGQALAPRHVVARVTVSPGQGQPDLRTSYRYKAPRFGLGGPAATHPGTPGFLGFAEVTVDSSGQAGDDARRVVQTFVYGLLGADGQGALASTATWIKRGTSHALISHVDYARGYDYLAGSTASVTYPTVTRARTCAADQNLAQCLAAPAGTLTTTQVWERWAPLNGPIPQVVLNVRTETTDGVASPRYSRREYEKRWTTTDGRLLTTVEEAGRIYSYNTVAGPRTLYIPATKTQTLYDTPGLPVETRAYKDGSTYTRTLRTFTVTGLVLSIKHPNQVAANTWPTERWLYDAFQLNPVSYVDQTNAQRFDTFDMATGARLSRQGPNWRYTNTSGGWAYDTESWTIDGFGRVLSHSASLDPAAGAMGYDLREVEQHSYVDNAVPNRHVTWKLQTVGTTWLGAMDEYDGAGRVLRATAFGGAGDAVTTYAYDAGGQLRTITAPSPIGAGTVPTTYARDGLGRTTALTRPDNTGERVTYAGLDTEVVETSPIDGDGARTTLRHDLYGQLRQVLEHDNPGAGQVAITTYDYDAARRVQSIVDADGVTTAMAYDWRGLRTSIARAGRTWSYGYDGNGNMTAQTEPVPAGGTAAQYTSTTIYDARNRPTSYTPATRGMTTGRVAQLGLGTLTMAYDGNGTYGPAHLITLPGFGSISRTYATSGQVAKETRTITLTATQGATLNTTQWVERRYDALGHPTNVTWDDGTSWRYAYDTRGDLADVAWRQPNGVEVGLAHYDRRVSGHPYRRTSAWSPQQRDWQYDVLGRVVADRVFRTTTGETLHERGFGFDGFGDLRLVDGQTAGLVADAVIEHDARHRVISAQGPLAYSGQFTYGKTGSPLTATVASGGGELPNRDVAYAYGATDPQAVDRLTDKATGAAAAAYLYDSAGNMTQRQIGWGAEWFTFGGDGLLHEVSSPTSVERYLFGPGAERLVAMGPEGVKLWFGESETLFSFAGAQQRRYHHVAAGEPIARAEKTTVGSAATLELQYADALQSLALTTSQDGQVRGAFVYGAFGELVGSSGSGNHRRGFNGKEADQASGLRHYGYRSYDPVALRWVSADPLFRFAPDAAWAEPQRANLYAFALNNAVRYYDPDGRDSKPAPAKPAKPVTCFFVAKCELAVLDTRVKVTTHGPAVEVRGATITEGDYQASFFTVKATAKDGVTITGVDAKRTFTPSWMFGGHVDAGPVVGQFHIGRDGHVEVTPVAVKISPNASFGPTKVKVDITLGPTASEKGWGWFQVDAGVQTDGRALTWLNRGIEKAINPLSNVLLVGAAGDAYDSATDAIGYEFDLPFD